MTKAEQAALKVYPKELTVAYGPLPGASGPCEFDNNQPYRTGFIEGYEAAEKDLALTWGDVQLLDHFVLELVGEERKGKDWGDGKGFYTEVLTRFKKFKEESHD